MAWTDKPHRKSLPNLRPGCVNRISLVDGACWAKSPAIYQRAQPKRDCSVALQQTFAEAEGSRCFCAFVLLCFPAVVLVGPLLFSFLLFWTVFLVLLGLPFGPLSADGFKPRRSLCRAASRRRLRLPGTHGTAGTRWSSRTRYCWCGCLFWSSPQGGDVLLLQHQTPCSRLHMSPSTGYLCSCYGLVGICLYRQASSGEAATRDDADANKLRVCMSQACSLSGLRATAGCNALRRGALRCTQGDAPRGSARCLVSTGCDARLTAADVVPCLACFAVPSASYLLVSPRCGFRLPVLALLAAFLGPLVAFFGCLGGGVQAGRLPAHPLSQSARTSPPPRADFQPVRAGCEGRAQCSREAGQPAASRQGSAAIRSFRFETPPWRREGRVSHFTRAATQAVQRSPCSVS